MILTILHSYEFKLFFTICCLVLGLGYLVVIFNNLIIVKNNMYQAWANIDVLLKQRHDELNKLVNVCQQYMGYEKDILVSITQTRQTAQQARIKHDINGLNQTENNLQIQLKKLIALAESYPDLKTNNSFLHLQKRIQMLETQLADRRIFYNNSVTQYNIRISSIPDLMVAKLIGYKKENTLQFAKGKKS